MPLTAGQYEIDGLMLGAGTVYKMRGLQFRRMPDIRVSDSPIPQAHGVFTGFDLMGGQDIDALIQVSDSTPEATWAALEALYAKLQPGTLKPLRLLPVGYDDVRRTDVLCRDRGENHMAARTFYEVPVSWFAPDPLIYSDIEHSASTGVPVAVGGRTYPRTYPYDYGAGPAGGSLVATNDGTVDASWQATITGPVTDPKLQLNTVGQFVGFNIALSPGEFIEIDSRAPQSVLLGGTSSRYSSLMVGSTWFGVPPGGSIVHFSAAAGTGTVEFRSRSAWL